MSKITCGFADGKRWLAGQIPMRKDLALEIDTRTGLGVGSVMAHMADTISWHASKIKLQSSTQDDIIQELNILVLAAIPEYDITKHANLMTFLQNHLRNRIVNLYKFATQSCRTAVHENYRLCKVRCPACDGFNLMELVQQAVARCGLCGYKKQAGERWRSYPLPIPVVSANENFVLEDGEEGSIQDFSSYEDLSGINASSGISYVDSLTSRLALQEFVADASETDRLILQYLLEGHTLAEICTLTGLAMKDAQTRLAGFSKGCR